MTDVLNIGVDFGGTGLRVAYVLNGGAPTLFDEPLGVPIPWLFCESSTSSPLQVTFPSLKSRLGVASAMVVNRQAAAPAALLSDVLREVRDAVARRTSRTVGQVVLSVPARYSSSQRIVLREAALGAGFADAHLINDSVAAVIAHHAGAETPLTVFVCSVGYSGFEMGVVRAARGHYRALGYEAGPAPSGSSLDLRLLEAVFDVVYENGLIVDTTRWDPSLWMQVRSEAERIKEELSTRQQVIFPATIQTPDGKRVARITFQRNDFEQAVNQMFGKALDRAQGLLEQAGIAASDVNALLLVGGTTRIPALQALIETRVGQKGQLQRREILAFGAALHATRLDTRRVAGGSDMERASDLPLDTESPAVAGPTVRADIEVSGSRPDGDQLVLLAQPAKEAAGTPDRTDPLAHARRLLDGGRTDEARKLLEGLVSEAQALLSAIATRAAAPLPPATGMSARARRTLTRARHLLTSEHFEEAVQTSHQAWKESPDNPDMFEQMIDVHCEAATRAGDPRRYGDAQRWLLCAYSHDEGNVRIRSLLADRHYLQAKHLFDRGKRKDAAQTLERCLSIDPEHVQAKGLQQQLAKR